MLQQPAQIMQFRFSGTLCSQHQHIPVSLLQTTTAAPPSSPTTLTMGNTASPSQQTPQISTFIEKFNFFTSFYNFLHLLHLINHYFCSPKPPYFTVKKELLHWCIWDLKNSTQLHCATGTIATFSMNKYWDLRSIKIISLTFSMQFSLQFTDRSDLFSKNIRDWRFSKN